MAGNISCVSLRARTCLLSRAGGPGLWVGLSHPGVALPPLKGSRDSFHATLRLTLLGSPPVLASGCNCLTRDCLDATFGGVRSQRRSQSDMMWRGWSVPPGHSPRRLSTQLPRNHSILREATLPLSSACCRQVGAVNTLRGAQ